MARQKTQSDYLYNIRRRYKREAERALKAGDIEQARKAAYQAEQYRAANFRREFGNNSFDNSDVVFNEIKIETLLTDKRFDQSFWAGHADLFRGTHYKEKSQEQQLLDFYNVNSIDEAKRKWAEELIKENPDILKEYEEAPKDVRYLILYTASRKVVRKLIKAKRSNAKPKFELRTIQKTPKKKTPKKKTPKKKTPKKKTKK